MIERTGRMLRMSPQLDAKVREYAAERGLSINGALIAIVERGLNATRADVDLTQPPQTIAG